MQRIAGRILVVCAFALSVTLASGCKQKNQAVEMAPVDASFSYDSSGGEYGTPVTYDSSGDYGTSATYDSSSSSDYSSGSTAVTSTSYQDPPAGRYSPGPASSDGYSSSGSGRGGGTVHVVAKGDTLYSLARMYYRDQSRWRTIYEANRGTLRSPDMVLVGQELVIP